MVEGGERGSMVVLVCAWPHEGPPTLPDPPQGAWPIGAMDDRGPKRPPRRHPLHHQTLPCLQVLESPSTPRVARGPGAWSAPAHAAWRSTAPAPGSRSEQGRAPTGTNPHCRPLLLPPHPSCPPVHPRHPAHRLGICGRPHHHRPPPHPRLRATGCPRRHPHGPWLHAAGCHRCRRCRPRWRAPGSLQRSPSPRPRPWLRQGPP